MDNKCAKCLINKSSVCNKIPDEYLVYTDVTDAEEQQDAARGVSRIGGSRAQRGRCILSMLGAQRIIEIAKQLQKSH